MCPTVDDFAALLVATFRAEAADHIEALSRGLLELEGGPAPERASELLDGMFRDAHSLKGAAAAADETRIAAICQPLESQLASWKTAATPPTSTELDSMSGALDTIAGFLEPVEAREAPASRAAQAPAPAAAPAGSWPAARADTRESSVRVAVAKVDALMLQAEELLTVKLAAGRNVRASRELDSETRAWGKRWEAARADLAGLEHPSAQALRRVQALFDRTSGYMSEISDRSASLVTAAERDQRHVGPLIDGILAQVERVLMVPFSSISAMFAKMVRDLARQEGKSVDLVVDGDDMEVDRRVLERLKSPLVHAIRNGVSHGIESSEERVAHGKDPRGTIRIAVSRLEENKVSVVVSDDGHGVDPAGLRAAAVATGAITLDQADLLDDEQSRSLAFYTGVSTTKVITDISGRGVGLDVVKRNIEQIDGTVALESTPGAGSILRIVVPTTLATIRGVVVEAAGRPFVVPTTLVNRVLRVEGDSIRSAAGQPTTLIDGEAVALADLARVLGLVHPRGDRNGTFVQVLVLGAGTGRIAFRVDSVVGEHDVLVKGLGPQLAGVSMVSGATVLGDGRIAPVLDTRGLVASARAPWAAGGIPTAEEGEPEPPRRVLVVEDSVTSRMLLRNILTTAGFSVLTTCDGMEAMKALESERFDAVVSDIEMPNADGFELTALIRADERLSGLPVVLVTSLESDADKARGIEAGANAYLVKSGFDKSSLIDTLHRWI